MTPPLRIAFFGLPLAAILLAADGVELSLSVLSPIDAPGRRRLRKLDVPVLDARDVKGARELEAKVDDALALAKPDLVVSWYFTRRLKTRWLNAAPLGAIGAHPSLLPRHRGPNPFFGAIDSGDRVTGVTVHRLVERYDEGAKLLSEELVIGARDSWQLARALDRPSLRLLRAAVRAFGASRRSDVLPETAQDERAATWAPEPTGELLRVDWTWTTERVLRRIRALSPVPGLAVEIRGVELSVVEAARAEAFPATLVPGEAAILPGAVVVRTLDGAVELLAATVLAPDDEDPVVIRGAALSRLLFDSNGGERQGGRL